VSCPYVDAVGGVGEVAEGADVLDRGHAAGLGRDLAVGPVVPRRGDAAGGVQKSPDAPERIGDEAVPRGSPLLGEDLAVYYGISCRIGALDPLVEKVVAAPDERAAPSGSAEALGYCDRGVNR